MGMNCNGKAPGPDGRKLVSANLEKNCRYKYRLLRNRKQCSCKYQLLRNRHRDLYVETEDPKSGRDSIKMTKFV